MPIEINSQSRDASVPIFDLPAIPVPHKAQRIPALDFAKGALVLLMVLYHWINYFVGPQWEYYGYLRFLTPSFIFIAGFMISNVYLSKYAASDPRLPKRLLARGFKLMAVFLVLNFVRLLIVPILGTGVVAKNAFAPESLFAIFVSGIFNPSVGKLVAFSILVPISYLLMLSGALMLPYRSFCYTFHVVFGLMLSSIVIMGWRGIRGFNLEFVAIGMLGVLIGFMPISVIDDFIRRPFILAIAYLCYLLAITFLSISFPLLVAGVILSVTVIYLVGASGSESGTIRREVDLLGKYSLFGYISQIAILQGLSVVSHRFNLRNAGLVISFVLAFALTIACVEAVDRARAKAATVDRLYKSVFA
jgi:peptidoglycan/LPS O-acetylase OafA/YrhL